MQIHNSDDYSLTETELSPTSKDHGEKLFSSGEIENLGDLILNQESYKSKNTNKI
jgi:hypothetical protein